MKVITTAALQENLVHYLKQVTLKGERIVVMHNEEEGDGRGVVIVPLDSIDDEDDLDGAGEMDATEYLLSNPANAAKLLESIAQARAGRTVPYDRAALGLVPEEVNS